MILYPLLIALGIRENGDVEYFPDAEISRGIDDEHWIKESEAFAEYSPLVFLHFLDDGDTLC